MPALLLRVLGTPIVADTFGIAERKFEAPKFIFVFTPPVGMGQEEEDHYLRMMADLNCQPFACKANALPIELIILYFFHSLLAPNFIYTRSLYS